MTLRQKSTAGAGALASFALTAALIAGLPPAASLAGDKPPQLSRELRSLDREFQAAIRALEQNTEAQLEAVPDVITAGAFPATIASIGDIAYDATGSHYQIADDFYGQLRGVINSIGPNDMDRNDLRGQGGKIDDYLESLLWQEPAEFAKGLEMSVRQVKLDVEFLEVSTDKLLDLGVDFSVQIYPNPQDTQLFTMPVVEPEQREPRIGAIVGGSYRRPDMSDAVSYACAFGVGKPNTMMDLIVTGLGGPFNQSGNVDAQGMWKICLDLKQGYYRFEADGGESVDVREIGFLFNTKVKF